MGFELVFNSINRLCITDIKSLEISMQYKNVSIKKGKCSAKCIEKKYSLKQNTILLFLEEKLKKLPNY